MECSCDGSGVVSWKSGVGYGNVGGHNDLVGCGDDAGVGSGT